MRLLTWFILGAAGWPRYFRRHHPDRDTSRSERPLTRPASRLSSHSETLSQTGDNPRR